MPRAKYHDQSSFVPMIVDCTTRLTCYAPLDRLLPKPLRPSGFSTLGQPLSIHFKNDVPAIGLGDNVHVGFRRTMTVVTLVQGLGLLTNLTFSLSDRRAEAHTEEPGGGSRNLEILMWLHFECARPG